MKPVRKLGIVGVGLIGGSAALAMRSRGLADHIVGLGRSQANLDVALARGIVDAAGQDAGILEGCDFVLLATPVGSIAANAAAVAEVLAPTAVVTDGGSVKADIVRQCRAVLGGRFVGSHPIAGSEESGAGAARENLFAGAVCVVTADGAEEPAAVARVREFWAALGMNVMGMAPAEHDHVLAITSHLPHLAAFALARIGAAEMGAIDALIGPSFREMTRVAASSPEMWRDIFLANADAVDDAAARMIEQLEALRLAARRGDGSALEAAIRSAASWKRALGETETVALPVSPAIGALRGSVGVPGDKSIGHRALLFGAVADGTTHVRGLSPGEDNASTIEVLRGLGVAIERDGDEATVHGRGFDGLLAPSESLNCGNSGTTMRLCCGLLAGRSFDTRLDGDASLRGRPMARLQAPLAALGAKVETTAGSPPLRVCGRALHGADVELRVASAQLKTAVILAGLQADGRTTVREPAQSRDHTERLLPHFGVTVETLPDGRVAVDGPAVLHAADVDVPGDPSAAAFWIVAASIVPGSEIRLPAIAVNPTRTGAIDVLEAMGASIEKVVRPALGAEPVADLVVRSARLHGTRVAGERMVRAIDEFPILAVAAAFAEGETIFADGAELRVKETDRLRAMAAGLTRLGATLEESAEGMRIRGGSLCGGRVASHGDHRIAMAFAVAALGASDTVEIDGADAIGVSDPHFLAVLEKLRTEHAK
jgi:3-phosphoshikimate 1-carboxyvinyltransferase